MKRFRFVVFIMLAFLFASGFTENHEQCNAIVGRWISQQGNVIVQIYKDSVTFKGKVLWFNDSDDKNNPMNSRTDSNNPDINLRNRKILGLDVLHGLVYNNKCNCWQEGKIYDVRSGRTWSSSIMLENEDLLKIRGFWHYEFIGKSMIFQRLK